MTRLLALPTGLASRICAFCSVLVMLTGAARAQSADPAAPPPAPAQPSVQDETTGGCEPIGLTASGEIVFPFRCKDMVERQQAAASKPVDPTPAAVAAAPAVQEKPQAKLHAKPQAQPVVAAAKMTAAHPAHAANAKPVAVHPAGAAPKAAKPAAQPVDAAHSPKNLEKNLEKSAEKTAEAKTTEAKATEVKADEAKPAEIKPAETTKSIPQVAGKAHEHRMGPPGCTQFQSYNAVSATYLGFDGQRHPCLEAAAGQVARNQVAGNQAARSQSPHKPSPAEIKH